MNSTDVNTEKKKRVQGYALVVLHLLILIAIIIAIYYPVLPHSLSNFDDLRWLEDTKIRNTFSTIFDPKLITKNQFASTYYLPLQSALFYGMVRFFGRSPFAFHSLSIGIHVAAALLLYFLILGYSRKKSSALLGAGFFAAYLGHTQSITWTAAAVSHPLVSVFVLATALFFRRYIRKGKKVFYVGAFVFFISALLIRESAIVVPFLLIGLELLEGTQNEKKWSLKQIKWTKGIKYLPFFLAILPIISISMQKFQHGNLNERWGGVATGVYPALRFLDFSTLLIYPAKMSVSWKLGLAGMLLFFASWILIQFRRFPELVFTLFWMVLALAPYTISNFNPTLAVTRYLYPVSIPFALFLVFAVERLGKKYTHSIYLTYPLFAFLIGAHFFYAWQKVH